MSKSSTRQLSATELMETLPSPAFQAALRLAKRFAADRTIKVLLTGPTGTGKSTIAKVIHSYSPVAPKPFVPLNLANQDDALAGSAMFGHVKGAFTGATADREGAFERANGGTIFLDEIDKCSSGIQAKLLHVVDTGEVERIGGNRLVPTDCRIVAATNRSLSDLVEQGKFLDDLLARIDGFAIPLPPLNERREDIPILAEWYLERHWRAHPISARLPSIHAELKDAFMRADWPRNVRDLGHAIHRLYILSDGAAELTLKHADSVLAFLHRDGGKLRNRSKADVLAAIVECRYNKTAAAEMLGCSRAYLHKWLSRHAPDLRRGKSRKVRRDKGDDLSSPTVA